MSQAQLAGKELTKGFISQLESGTVRPSIRSLQIIASRLGKSLDYFLGDEPLSTQKRAEFHDLVAQAAFERNDWQSLARVVEEAERLDLDPPHRAKFLRWKAHAKLGLERTEDAFSAVDEALSHPDIASDPASHAWVLLVQGVAYITIGQVLASAQSFERALAIVNEQEVLDARLRTRLLMNLGTAYRRLNRPAKAIQLYESALGLANHQDDLHATALALMGVAVSLYDSGELDGAIANYRRALELFHRISDQRFELSVLQSLAVVSFEQNAFEKAEAYARQCRDRAAAVGDEHVVAVADGEIARIMLANGDVESAARIAQLCEQILARFGDVKQRASALRTLAAAEDRLGDHAAADRHFQDAIELATSIELFPDVSRYAAEYAERLRERKEYERAFHYLDLARRNAAAI